MLCTYVAIPTLCVGFVSFLLVCFFFRLFLFIVSFLISVHINIPLPPKGIKNNTWCGENYLVGNKFVCYITFRSATFKPISIYFLVLDIMPKYFETHFAISDVGGHKMKRIFGHATMSQNLERVLSTVQ